MVKQHLKRLNIPNTWHIKKKEHKFVVRPKPGPHSLNTSMPLLIILRDKLHLARTMKEARNILNEHVVMVDKVRKKDPKLPVGLFDVVYFKDSETHYRLCMDSKGRIQIQEAKKDTDVKPCKVKGKRYIKKGQIALTLFDGRTLITDKNEYKVNDTILLEMLKNEVKQHIKFEKGCLVLITDGKHAGETGSIEDIKGDKIILKSKGGSFETAKKYVYVIGKDKPVIEIAC